MTEIWLEHTGGWLQIEQALQLLTEVTTSRDKQRFTHEQNEQALRDAAIGGKITLVDLAAMRQRKKPVTDFTSATALSSSHFLISCEDFRRFAEFRFVKVHVIDGDEENELGYTIQGAATALAAKYSISERDMRERIFDAAEQAKLQVRDPRTGMPYIPKIPSYRYERISIAELNRWFEDSDVLYRLGSDAGELTATSASTRPRDIDRGRVMQIFPVRPKADQNRKFWDDKLGRPPLWLVGARTFVGRRGLSARWDPLSVAHALLGQKYMNLSQLDSAIHEHLPDLMEQWKEQTDDLR